MQYSPSPLWEGLGGGIERVISVALSTPLPEPPSSREGGELLSYSAQHAWVAHDWRD
jgi:hypothetical protein